MLELVKGEEQDNELNCSKSDKNLVSSASICKESYYKYTSTDRPKFVELETFDTFYDDCTEFKKYIDDILKSFNFGKEFDILALPGTNNDANSVKRLELQNELTKWE